MSVRRVWAGAQRLSGRAGRTRSREVQCSGEPGPEQIASVEFLQTCDEQSCDRAVVDRVLNYDGEWCDPVDRPRVFGCHSGEKPSILVRRV